MVKLFIQLIYIMFFLIKYTKCDIYLEKIEEITEINKNEILLFTEYKKNSLLGVSKQNIYIISPFNVTKINYSNRYSFLANSTNIISLDDDTFALVCLKEVLIAVYNITGALILDSSISEYSPFLGIKCGVTYQNTNFYIGIPDNKTEKINFFYLIVKNVSNTLSEINKIELKQSNYNGFRDLNILINNVKDYSLIILPEENYLISYYVINLTNNPQKIIKASQLEIQIIAKGAILQDSMIIILGRGIDLTLKVLSFEISNREQSFKKNNSLIFKTGIIANSINGYIKNETNFSLIYSGGVHFLNIFLILI